jgi:hypothetical protein
MMNCFETRNEFRALWRKTVSGERRAELLAHLGGCAKCDHAFRVFALTAPVLHSEVEPEGNVVEAVAARANGRRELRTNDRGQDRARREGGVARIEAGPRRWFAMSAAAAIFVFASGAAYWSERSSTETLHDAVLTTEAAASSEAAVDPFAPELPTTESDLAS